MSWLIKLDADLIRQVIIQGATFLAFFIIVKVFFADKVKDILEQRKNAACKDLDDAKAAKDESEKLLESYKEQMTEIGNEKARILKEANEEGKKARETIVSKANEEAGKLLENAKNNIERQKKDAEREIREKSVDLAVDMAEKVTNEALDREASKKLIDDFINSLGKE